MDFQLQIYEDLHKSFRNSHFFLITSRIFITSYKILYKKACSYRDKLLTNKQLKSLSISP